MGDESGSTDFKRPSARPEFGQDGGYRNDLSSEHFRELLVKVLKTAGVCTAKFLAGFAKDLEKNKAAADSQNGKATFSDLLPRYLADDFKGYTADAGKGWAQDIANELSSAF